MAVEDTLEVQVKTEADKALATLDRVAGKIGDIASALNKLDVSNLSNVFSGLNKQLNGISSQVSNMGNAAKNTGASMSKGMKKASKAADDVKNKTKDMAKSFDMSAYNKAISEFSTKFANAGKGSDLPETMSELQGLSDKLSAKLDTFYAKEEKVMSVGATNPMSKSFQDLQYDIQATLNRMDAVSAKIQELREKSANGMANIEIIRTDGIAEKIEGEVGEGLRKVSQLSINPYYEKSSFEDYKSHVKGFMKEKYNIDVDVSDQSVQKTDSLRNKVDELKNKLKDLSKQGLNFGDAEFDKTYSELNKAEKELSEYKNGLTQVDSEQKKVAISNPFGKISAVASSAVGKIKAFASSFASGISGINKMGQSVDNLTSKLAKLFIGFQALKGVGKTLLGSIESASDYIEGYNYFDVATSKVAEDSKNDYKKYGYENAEEYADSFSERLRGLTSKMTAFNVDENGGLSMSGMKNLGMNIAQITQYQGQLMQMTNSVGMMGEASLATSKAMAMLAGDMSSLTNMPIETVMSNFTSGLSGQSMALKKYGIDITNTSLAEQAAALGIQKKISAMTQSEKMMLREIVMIKQSRVAWGDQANTINQLANQYRMLQANLKNTSMLIGALLKPVIASILPYLNAMAMAVNDLLGYLGKFFGIDMGGMDTSIKAPDLGVDTSSWDDMDTAAADVADSIDDAAKAQKKYNKQLQGFDKLNNLTTTKTDGSSSSKNKTDTGGGDVSGALSNALLDAVKDYEKVWNTSFDNMTNTAENLKNKIEKLFTTAWNTGDGTEIGKAVAGTLNKGIKYVNDHMEEIANGLNNIASILATSINGFVEDFDWSGFGQAVGGVLKASLHAIGTFFDKTDWVAMGQGLATSLLAFIESGAIEEMGSTVGKGLKSAIELAFGAITEFNLNDGFSKLGTSIGTGINNFFNEMGKTNDKTGMNGWQELGQSLSTGIIGIMTALTAAIGTLNPQDIGSAIKDLINKVEFKDIAFSFSDLATTLLSYLTGVIKGIPWEDLGQSISDLFTNIQWGSIAIELSGLAENLLGGITKSIGSVNWLEVGQSIGTFINNIEWGDIFKDLGKLALALITGIANAIKGFAQESPIGAAIAGLFAAPKIISAISSIVSLVGSVGTAIGGVVSTIASFASGISTAVQIISAVAGISTTAVAEIAAGIAVGIAAIVDLWNTSETFRTAVVEAFTKVKDAIVTTFAEKVIPTVKEVASSIAGFVSSVVDFYENSPLKAIVALFASLVATIGGNVLSTAITAIGTAFEGIGKFVSGVIDTLSGILDVLTGLMTLDFDKIGSGFKKIGSGIKKAMSGVLTVVVGVGTDLIKGMLSGIVSELKTIASWLKEHVFNPIVNNVKKLFGIHSPSTVFAEFGGYMIDGLKEGLSGIWESIKGIFTGLWSSLKSWWETNVKLPEIKLPSAEDVKKKIGEIKDKWEGWKAKGKDLVTEAKEKAGSKIKTIKDTWEGWEANGKDLVTEAKEKAGSTIDKIKKAWNDWKPKSITLDIITKPVQTAIKSIVDWINKYIIQNMNKLISKLPGKFSSKTIPELSVPQFAAGGYPQSASLFYANENGRAELIGRQGNRTTVVNNEQIIKSVSAGVSDAVFNTMNPVLTHLVASINKMNNTQTGTPLYVEGVNEGDIVRITTDANRDYKNRTGRPLYA